MVGSIAANLHEGSRSEYLAQYIFASFGTVVSVPHQEDTGLDLYCTLTERLGQRAFPRAYFSVQVKSTMDPWVLDGRDSVDWLIKHPLPVFLCVVDKQSSRLRVYHTAPRFYAWALPPIPERLELVPTTDEVGRCVQWSNGSEFSLSAPILDACIKHLVDDSFHARAKEVLRFWADIDVQNLARMTAGLHVFRMPDAYQTNATTHRAWVEQGVVNAPDLRPVVEYTKRSLAYLASQLRNKGDFGGAVRCALLHRHLAPEYSPDDDPIDPGLQHAINNLAPAGDASNFLFRGVDWLNRQIDQFLAGNTPHVGR